MTLTEKQQSIVTIAAWEAKGDQQHLRVALNDGLEKGLSLNEEKEVLSQLYAYTGFPRSINATNTLRDVVEDRKRQGKETKEGRDSNPYAENYDALKQGTEVQTMMSGKPFSFTFSPATDYYLKAHLFGDIFARTTLTYAQRELTTVSAIAALEGCESQLMAHIAGALRMGVSQEELRGIPNVLEHTVGATEAYRLRKCLATVFEEPFTEGRPVNNMMFPQGQPNEAYAKYFTGNSYLAMLASGEGKLPIANVTFEPRCRNNWHIHNGGGQILICVGGEGWYQEWNRPARKLHPGDVVDIPAGVKHWHGATKDSWFQHIAIGVPVENSSTEWLEPVTDEVYNGLE